MKKFPAFAFLGLLCCACNSGDYIGADYLGVKYLNSPLGEEKLPDADPLIRFDAFDCTTFVETVVAGGKLKKLTDIRYKNGKVDFLSRNHFIESDWLKNNEDLFQNVSSKYGKTDVKTVVIDKQNWLKKVHGIDAEFPIQPVSIEYIPFENLKRIENKKELIVLFITGNSEIYDKIGTDLAVVHMGFLLPDGRLRHASSTAGCVVDVDFYDYVKKSDWLGVTLVEIK